MATVTCQVFTWLRWLFMYLHGYSNCQVLAWLQWLAMYLHGCSDVSGIYIVTVTCQIFTWLQWLVGYLHGCSDVSGIYMNRVTCHVFAWLQWLVRYLHGCSDVSGIYTTRVTCHVFAWLQWLVMYLHGYSDNTSCWRYHRSVSWWIYLSKPRNRFGYYLTRPRECAVVEIFLHKRHGPMYPKLLKMCADNMAIQVTHLPIVPNICISESGQHWLSSIGFLGTNFSEILIEIHKFSFTKMHLKISSAQQRPFCPGGDELPMTSAAWYWPDSRKIFRFQFQNG